MFDYYDDSTMFLSDRDSVEKERLLLEPTFDIALECIMSHNICNIPDESKFVGSQIEVQTEILGVPFRGFVDFVFESEKVVTVIDLKTKSRLMKSRSDLLQQAIYKKALREKFNGKPVDVSMLIVTPKKFDIVDILNTEVEMKEIEMSLQNCANIMRLCKTKEDIKSLITPNLDDWNWSNQDLLIARQEIWKI